MKKEYRNGLFMDNSILIEDYKKTGLSVLTWLFNILAILIGSWSMLSVFLESIRIPAHITSIHLTIVLTFAFVFILCLIPSYSLVKVFFCVLFYSLLFISRYKAIMNGFYIIENKVIDIMEPYYNIKIGKYVADYITEEADCSLFMIMITIPVVSLITIAVVREKLIRLASVIMLLPVAISFLLGLTPSENYFVSCAVAVLYMTRLGYNGVHPADKKQKNIMHKINSWAGLWLCMISLILFFIMKLVITEDNYYNFTQIKDVRKSIQTRLNSITLEDITYTVSNYSLPDFSTSKGGLSGGSLGRTGNVEYTGSEQLRITTAYDAVKDGVYLKGYVGSNYTGEKWGGLTDDEAAEYSKLLKELPFDYDPINQNIKLIYAGRNAGILKDDPYRMRVEYIDANKRFLYSPYFTAYESMQKISSKQDLYITPGKKESSYSYAYYDLMDMSKMDVSIGRLTNIYDSIIAEDDYYDYEMLYRKFVEKVYTRVPEDGLERLKKLCNDISDSMSLNTVEDKISYIKSYLSENTSYTLKPGKAPHGTDYVEYFLFDNKRGYCSHYASAAVLMLRLLGVPARYVEGYTVSPSDIAINRVGEVSYVMDDNSLDGEVEISIKDYNAHAWVEVYINGIGWIPADFTPPNGIGYNAYDAEEHEEHNEAEQDAKGALSPTPVEEKSQDNKDNMQKPDISGPANNTIGDENGIKEQAKINLRRLITPIMVLFLPVCAAALLNLRRIICFRRASNNYKVIYLFARVEKILNFISGGIFRKRIRLEDNADILKYRFDFIDSDTLNGFMDTVLKARYGRERISAGELRQVISFYNGLLLKTCNELPLIKRFALMLILLAD